MSDIATVVRRSACHRHRRLHCIRVVALPTKYTDYARSRCAQPHVRNRAGRCHRRGERGCVLSHRRDRFRSDGGLLPDVPDTRCRNVAGADAAAGIAAGCMRGAPSPVEPPTPWPANFSRAAFFSWRCTPNCQRHRPPPTAATHKCGHAKAWLLSARAPQTCARFMNGKQLASRQASRHAHRHDAASTVNAGAPAAPGASESAAGSLPPASSRGQRRMEQSTCRTAAHCSAPPGAP